MRHSLSQIDTESNLQAIAMQAAKQVNRLCCARSRLDDFDLTSALQQ